VQLEEDVGAIRSLFAERTAAPVRKHFKRLAKPDCHVLRSQRLAD